MIQLHDVHSLHSIDWESKKMERMYEIVSCLFQKGVTAFIENINTQLFLLEVDDLILPVTLNNAEFENSYVCSPYTHYISYALEELWELKTMAREAINLSDSSYGKLAKTNEY